jgi:sigma-B regulation protein RsbU (phosphoserine phosphatase)
MWDGGPEGSLMKGKLHAASERAADAFASAREWMRRVMPRVAVAAGVLYILRLLLRNTAVYKNTPLGLIGPLTFIAVCTVLVYYGLKILVRLKRKLLWRVRRRLIITYLFVGLTPVVLLLLLGGIAATGGSSQAMVRVVTVQLEATERQTLESARSTAEGLLALPPNANERAAQTWLDERAALLQATLPGSRVSAWRVNDVNAANGGAARLGVDSTAQIASANVNDETRGVGSDTSDAREPLPQWLAGLSEWSGLAYMPPPEDSRSAFGTPYVRALARRSWNGRSVAVLVAVPVSRALIKRLRETTGVNVRPFFIGTGATQTRGPRGINYAVKDDEMSDAQRFDRAGDGVNKVVNFDRDQFGEEIPQISTWNIPFPVFMPATDWTTGVQTPQWSFVVDWSWTEGGKQFWSNAVLGPVWWQGLYSVAIAFLVLEILALLSAAWMTRAVTGTVHKLYRATESVQRGDFSHRIRTRSRDQLGELAVAFNDMSSNIETLLAERVEHERLKREIEIAHEVQAQLFPRTTPVLSTAEITGECRAALGVAGDYYDYIEVAPGLIAFTLGDVSGKGLSASLVMSNLQAALRAQAETVAERMRLAGDSAAAAALTGGKTAAAVASTSTDGGQTLDSALASREGDGPREVARMTASINEQLCRATDSNRFATLFLALYDDRTRTLRYTNAGHNAPVLVRADGTVERLTTGGIVVGAFPSVVFEEGRTVLGEGDLLVLFSDGVTEAQSATGEEYGEGKFASFVAARRDGTASNLRRAVFEEIDRWSGDAERGDDQTLVILKAVSS